MSAQRITIAKLGGDAGLATTTRFRGWADLRQVSHPEDGWSADQWPIDARREIDVFASSLRSRGHELPVLFFSDHVDSWSSGGHYRRWLEPGGDGVIEVHSDRHEVWCYSLPDAGRLADHLRRAARLKRIRRRDSPEERWFTVRLLDAVLACESLVEVAAVIVLREVVGGLVEDSEIEASLKGVPNWIFGDPPKNPS